MKTIGIVGGIASGKSLVASQLQSLGALVVDADRLGHEVLEVPEVRDAIRSRWGDSVLGPDDRVDRAAVARRVFRDPDGPSELRFLEQLTHPRIGHRLRAIVDEARREGRVKAVVIDAPLLYRAGLDALCDEVIYVDASRELREARVARRGWPVGELGRREAAQDPLEEQKKRATWLLDNSQNAEATRDEIARFWRERIDQEQDG